MSQNSHQHNFQLETH